MKNVIKIIFVVLVILGLIGSYMNLGSFTVGEADQQANVEETFKGPDSAPATNGPSDLPPGN